MNPRKPHALIIGGSVGGLLAASLLERIGWTVTLFERSEGDLSGRGAGLAVTENLLEITRSLGARIDPSSAAVVKHWTWIDAGGMHRFNLERESLASAWPRVYRPLRDLVPDAAYRAGMTLEDRKSVV